MRTLFAFVVWLGLASGAYAASVGSADIVFIVDESGSMGGEQDFLEDIVDDLDILLALTGITDVNYGVIGFGRTANSGDPRDVSSGLTDLTGAQNALANLEAEGSFEDGFVAIQFALDNLALTAETRFFILVTDEDRDIGNRRVTKTTVSDGITNADVTPVVIVNNQFFDDTGTRALGIDADGEAFVADGTGGFNVGSTDANSIGFSEGSTDTDYVDLALTLGGTAWDLNLLRAGGSSAQSFSNAFLGITTGFEPAPSFDAVAAVPVPASLPLLAAGIGFLAYRRHQPH
ncbi:MAG: vWA domain-containing protein [Pseudomonadota bacterium]